jgi:GTPase
MANIDKKKKAPPGFDASGYKELTIAVLGSVDAGKSSTIGSLVFDVADNGNGLSRSRVFVHDHEKRSGRTSDISFQYMRNDDLKVIITFVDLAGHEKYLKTTLTGVTSTLPDYAIVCVSDVITKMTKEHIGMCYLFEIPYCILLTKTDADKGTNNILNSLTNLLIRKSKLFEIKDLNNISQINYNSFAVIPFIRTSNVSREGHDLVKSLLFRRENLKYILPDGFVVERIYIVVGHGIVVSGRTSINIKRGDSLMIGPFADGEFLTTKVRSIHNNYRFPLEELTAGSHGCLAISSNKFNFGQLRKGMVLNRVKPVSCVEFLANICILHSSTTIRPGFIGFLNCGSVKESVKIISMYKSDTQIEIARGGDLFTAKLQFMQNHNVVAVGQRVIFREGLVKGYGTIIKLCE